MKKRVNAERVGPGTLDLRVGSGTSFAVASNFTVRDRWRLLSVTEMNKSSNVRCIVPISSCDVESHQNVADCFRLLQRATVVDFKVSDRGLPPPRQQSIKLLEQLLHDPSHNHCDAPVCAQRTSRFLPL
jgi:hypothetical protein